MPQILVIDDDPGLLSVCSVGLQALGHAVRTAETGEEGISQAALHAPDVIVLDLGLPDLDGLVVCKRIRIWSEVPIIVLSADGSEDRKVDALEHGAELEHYRVFATDRQTTHLDSLELHQKQDSRCRQFTISLGGGLVRSSIEAHRHKCSSHVIRASIDGDSA